jgi:hypothetical protein
MSPSPIRWYIKAQLGVLLLPIGLCLFGEAVSRKVVQMLGQDGGPWFWYGTLSLICINAGIGLMVESGLTRGFPGRKRPLIKTPWRGGPGRHAQAFPRHESASVHDLSTTPKSDPNHPKHASVTDTDRYAEYRGHP